MQNRLSDILKRNMEASDCIFFVWDNEKGQHIQIYFAEYAVLFIEFLIGFLKVVLYLLF